MVQKAANGTLRCYNQFPYHYKSFDEMIAQLDEIAAMGFNAVWTSPLHPVSAAVKHDGKTGSLYAMTDPWKWRDDFFGTSDVEGQKAKLREYTAKAKKLGLNPMFDLVLKHMGIGATYVQGDPVLLAQGIDTAKWFSNEYFQVSGQIWDDVRPFNYNDPNTRTETLEHLWKPFARMYIEELGFGGMRIDAAQHIYAEVVKDMIGYVRGLALQHTDSPVILAEILGSDETQRHYLKWHEMDGVGITHITNYAFWKPCIQRELAKGDKGYHEAQSKWAEEIAGCDHEKGEALSVVRLTPNHEVCANRRGGTIGFADFHDEQPVISELIKEGIGDPVVLEKILREKIAVAALYSDAGWFVCTGFEYGDSRRRSVFLEESNESGEEQKHPNMRPNDDASNPHLDLRNFIAQINRRVAQRPTLGFPNWAERLFLDDKPEIVIISTHDGHGFSGANYIDIINTDPTKIVTLNSDDVQKLAEMTGRDKHDFAHGVHNSRGIFMCGGIRVAPIRANILLGERDCISINM